MFARRNAPQPFGMGGPGGGMYGLHASEVLPAPPMPDPVPVDEGGTPEKGEGTPEMGDRKIK